MNTYHFDATRTPPGYLFIEMTTECNLKCKQCHAWMTREDLSRSLTTDEKVELIEEFARLNPQGTVVFTGGETMKKTEQFFALSKRCYELNLCSAVNTNATFINSPQTIKDLITFGPRYLVVSLDSRFEDIHDNMRGVKGTYHNTVNALMMLVEEKRANPQTKTHIITNSIIMDSNYNDLIEYIEFARGLGIDGVMFQMLSRTFWKQTEKDLAFEKYFPRDKEKFKAVIDRIMQKYSSDPFVVTNPMDFTYMKMYVDDPDFAIEPVCASHEKNIMVDTYGDAYLCFSMREFMNGQCLGNARDSSLETMWKSKIADDARSIMADCRRNCGMLNCHRRSCI